MAFRWRAGDGPLLELLGSSLPSQKTKTKKKRQSWTPQKIDKVVTIYSKFRFDYHKGKQPGMVNALLPLKCLYSLIHYGIFKTLRHVKC